MGSYCPESAVPGLLHSGGHHWPAITALHYVTTKMAGEKDGTPVVGNFFKSFRANFRQGVLMGILFGAAGDFWAMISIFYGIPEISKTASLRF